VLVDEWERDPVRGAFPVDPVPDHDPISHLELVRRSDVLCVVPASANTLAKLAAGLADNLLTSSALASRAPLVLAPAMNNHMYEHPATRANLAALEERGARIVHPEVGALASAGEWGVGRLAAPAEVLAGVEEAVRGSPAYAPRSLDGLRVLVTAGGTREPIDPVRYVGNRSSGRMGLAVAEEAASRGADVTLVAANVSLARPEGVKWVDVSTASELDAAARKAFGEADVLVMAAAVADFRPARTEAAKVSKHGREGLSLELEPTSDVLAALSAARRPDQTLVGFAAEHGPGGSERAREKLTRKGLDAVVLNDVAQSGIGFEAEDNEVTIVTAAGAEPVGRGPKAEVARAVLDAIERLRAGAAEVAR
jgi:phosphopantothenoylcysteine decarboxylase/phosphopantothenate--cysteine ligase